MHSFLTKLAENVQMNRAEDRSSVLFAVRRLDQMRVQSLGCPVSGWCFCMSMRYTHSALCLKSHREQFIFYEKNEQSQKSLTNSNHDIEWPTLENPFSLRLFLFSLTLPTRYLAGYCHSFLCSRIRGRRRWKKGSFKWRQILQFRTVTLFDSLLVRMFLLADVCVCVCSWYIADI